MAHVDDDGSHGVDRFECRFVYSWPVHPWPYAQTLVPTHVFRSCELVLRTYFWPPIFGTQAKKYRRTHLLGAVKAPLAASTLRHQVFFLFLYFRPLFAIRYFMRQSIARGEFFLNSVSRSASNPAGNPASQPISPPARPIPPVTLKSTSSWTVSDRQELWSVRWKA